MEFEIGSRMIGEGHPCFIIAEAGINHNGDLDIAGKMVDAAVDCGVDALKFQTFTASEFVGDKSEVYTYETQGKKVSESMLDMFARHEFRAGEWREIADYCRQKGIIFFSTPQDRDNLALLNRIGVPAIKVGSDDLVNLPLIRAYAGHGLPMILSTGMGYLDEIESAVKTVLDQNSNLALLHCTSQYPTPLQDLNLSKITELKRRFPNTVTGFSDHSSGCEAAVMSVALGAKIFEKHFTLDRNMYGPDHRFSSDPAEMASLVRRIRETETSLGSPELSPTEKEKDMRNICHRTIVAVKDIQEGEIIRQDMIALKRPAKGLYPKYMERLVGQKAEGLIKKGEYIKRLFTGED
ncbi:MAG: N-acetylneuraminate synthase family protein [Desulfobacterales bacterium]|nr:N-acetylneuraminate synthase family protein [Desulfobacterales bacterium]